MSQKLFEYLHNELGVTALVDQMDEIKRIVLNDSNEDMTKEACVDCGQPTKNGGSACAGACASERHYGCDEGDIVDTRGLLTCNCCDSCRVKCVASFLECVEINDKM